MCGWRLLLGEKLVEDRVDIRAGPGAPAGVGHPRQHTQLLVDDTKHPAQQPACRCRQGHDRGAGVFHARLQEPSDDVLARRGDLDSMLAAINGVILALT